MCLLAVESPDGAGGGRLGALGGVGHRLGVVRPVGQQVSDFPSALGVVVRVELHEQHRVGPLGEDRLDEFAELLGLGCQSQQHVVQHLDGSGVVFEDGRDVRQGVEQRLVGEQGKALRLGDGFERDGGLGDDGERPLAARQETRDVDGLAVDEVVRTVDGRVGLTVERRLGLGDERVEVVPGDVALEFGERRGDSLAFLVDDPREFGVDAGLQVAVGARGFTARGALPA